MLNKKIFHKYGYLFAIISGLMMALPLVISKLSILQWIAFIPTAIALYVLADDVTVKYRKLYLLGLAYFYPYFVVVFHWFYYMHPMDFAGLATMESLFVVTLACFGLAAFQALAAALIFPIFAWLSRGIFLKKCQIIKPFLISAMFVFCEWSQTLGW